jgi:biopolymer transport protein ExbD
MKLRVLDEDEPAINLTPMIDVIFTLLVFFMLATTFLERERLLDLELPTASHANPSLPNARELVINVAVDGRVWVDGRQVSSDELASVLTETFRRDAATPVTVRGDRRSQLEQVVRVLDECMRVGLANVGVSTHDGT